MSTERLITWVTGSGSGHQHAILPGTAFTLCGQKLNTPVPSNGPQCVQCRDAVREFEADVTSILPRSAAAPDEPYTFADMIRNHPVVTEVNREFEEAGGVWPSMASNPVNVRQMRRELEAIIREHNDNYDALIREITGYVELAGQAFYAEGHAAALAETAAAMGSSS